MKNQKQYCWGSGFTLIEVMVVVVILGILAAIVVPKIVSRPEQAKVVKVQQDILAIESALELYKLDNGVYPTTDQGLDSLITAPTISPAPKNWKEGGYLKRLTQDPWGHPYQYLHPGYHGVFDLFSLGADNQPGGVETDADIGNWDSNET